MLFKGTPQYTQESDTHDKSDNQTIDHLGLSLHAPARKGEEKQRLHTHELQDWEIDIEMNILRHCTDQADLYWTWVHFYTI